MLNTSLEFWIRKSIDDIDEWIGVGNFMDFSDEVLGVKWNGNHAHVHSMGLVYFHLHLP